MTDKILTPSERKATADALRLLKAYYPDKFSNITLPNRIEQQAAIVVQDIINNLSPNLAIIFTRYSIKDILFLAVYLGIRRGESNAKA